MTHQFTQGAILPMVGIAPIMGPEHGSRYVLSQIFHLIDGRLALDNTLSRRAGTGNPSAPNDHILMCPPCAAMLPFWGNLAIDSTDLTRVSFPN